MNHPKNSPMLVNGKTINTRVKTMIGYRHIERMIVGRKLTQQSTIASGLNAILLRFLGIDSVGIYFSFKHVSIEGL